VASSVSDALGVTTPHTGTMPRHVKSGGLHKLRLVHTHPHANPSAPVGGPSWGAGRDPPWAMSVLSDVRVCCLCAS
jgi:hypothetical protein